MADGPGRRSSLKEGLLKRQPTVRRASADRPVSVRWISAPEYKTAISAGRWSSKLVRLGTLPEPFRLASGPIDDIDRRVKRQGPRLLAGNANDLVPGHDHILNYLTCGKHEWIRLAPMLSSGNDRTLVRSLSGRMYRLAASSRSRKRAPRSISCKPTSVPGEPDVGGLVKPSPFETSSTEGPFRVLLILPMLGSSCIHKSMQGGSPPTARAG